MNSIVFILLAAAMIGVAFYLVALPLLQHARSSSASTPASSEQERLNELLAQREAAFQALRELNFDHKVGKITDEDFVAFEAGLKQNAAATLRALDAWEAEADDDLDLTMERQIQARRQALATEGNGRSADGRQAAPSATPCPKCGSATTSADRFCASCGADLAAARAAAAAAAPKPAGPVCPSCGKPTEPGDRFCGSCGQPLTAETSAPAR